MKKEIVRIEDIANMTVLWAGWVNCSQGDGKDERRDVTKFAENLTENLKSLQQRLLNGEWEPDIGKTFDLFTEGKWREIHTVGVEDRIVHYALIEVFKLNRRFVKRTFGSIKGRGTLKANKQVRRDIYRSGFKFCVKLDIKHYYPSIVKAKMMELIRQRYKGEAAIKLFEKVLMAYKPHLEEGISIGSQTSQDGGNFYLTPMDYLVLYMLDARYYTRYVDGIVILVKDKTEARMLIEKLTAFIKDYGLVFGKIAVFPIDKRRIDFCSYAVNGENSKVRDRNKKRFIRKLHQLEKHPRKGDHERNSVCSYLGILKHCDSYNLLKRLEDEYNEVFRRINRYAKGKRGKKNDDARAGAEHVGVPPTVQPPGRRARKGRNRRGDRGTVRKRGAGAGG